MKDKEYFCSCDDYDMPKFYNGEFCHCLKCDGMFHLDNTDTTVCKLCDNKDLKETVYLMPYLVHFHNLLQPICTLKINPNS